MTQVPGGANERSLSAETAGRYLGALFDAHARRALGLCRLLPREPIEAEDAAQQPFLSAYRSRLNGHSPRDPRIWLSAIARNECLARLRTRAVEQPLPVVENEPADDDVIQIASRREQVAPASFAAREIVSAFATAPALDSAEAKPGRAASASRAGRPEGRRHRAHRTALGVAD